MSIKISCRVCGEQFVVNEARAETAKYCSPECYARGRVGRRIPLPKRFWAKVKKTAGCWEWQGCKQSKGYGQINIEGKAELAHRVSWELHNGPIPDGLCVLHHCDNPACVRPDHLFLGTEADNYQDMVEKDRNVVPSGEDAGTAKLTNREAGQVRSLYRSGAGSSRELAERFGVSHTTVQAIVRQERYKDV